MANRRKRRKTHPAAPPTAPAWLVVVRTVIGPTFAIGGMQLIPTSYWLGAAVVYVGLALTFAEILLDPAFLRLPYQLKKVFLGIVLCVAALFTLKFVAVAAPLEVIADLAIGQYPTGTVVDGIQWDSQCTEVKVIVWNRSDSDYEAFDAFLQPDKPIVAAAPIADIPEVHVILPNPVTSMVETRGGFVGGIQVAIPGPDGKPENVPLKWGTYLRCRIQCQIIPRGSSTTISLVTAELGKLSKPGERQSFVREVPTKLHLYGTYRARYKTWIIDKIIPISHAPSNR
jgi:hypothetical protein